MSQAVTNKADLEEDVDLVHAAQRSPEAFRVLYEKYFRQTFLFVLRRVNEKALCADITSQVFLKAMLKIKDFRFKGVPFSAWLYRIALNECYEFFRKNKRYRFVSVEEYYMKELHEELTAETGLQELFEKLPFILQMLEQDELHLLELRYFEQRPFKEVAAILNISENNAKVKIIK